MQPRIEFLESKKMLGMHLSMSLTNDRTYELFSAFMPRRDEISPLKAENIYDLRVYPDHYFEKFNPANNFIKWALREVSTFEKIPEGMNKFELGTGQYAVFLHKGWNPGPEVFQYIFTQWLPKSAYLLDDRPHFEKFGPKTKRNSPDSQEEIWIPVRSKS